jgi:hypothetical protein
MSPRFQPRSTNDTIVDIVVLIGAGTLLASVLVGWVMEHL